MDYSSHFRGKKITVMGLGLLGRALGVVKFLAECGADLIVTDLKTKEQLASSLDQLIDFPNIKYVLGEHHLEDFRDRDMIIKSAGVPLDSIYIAEAQNNGVPIKMESSLFASMTSAKIIGVTGTRGKSTVTHFIFESLQKYYKNGKVFLGGNVKGLATLPLLKEVGANDLVVLELDSWQLQGFGDEKISPHISVFTNFMQDHLNYYMRGGNSEAKAMEIYFADKANIFRHQNKSDYLIVSAEMAHSIVKKYPLLQSEIVTVHEKDLPEDWQINIPGKHNRENLALGVAVLKALGLTEEMIRESAEDFKGVPGRLELVREIGGVKIYNDTNATTPAATVAGLESLDAGAGQKNIVLIMGGADKKLDMTKLVNVLPNFCRAVVLLSGTGTDTVKEKIKNSNTAVEVGSLSEAVKQAFGLAQKGDAILFSPAFASFGLFNNEYDRGDQFNALIKELK